MSWPSIKLKRIATTVAGGTPAVNEPSYWTDDDDGLAWVSIGDMSDTNKVTETHRRVSDAGIKAARLPIGDIGTLLLSMYASLGHTAFLGMPASWNQAILGINPTPETDRRFLKYALEALRPHLGEFARSNTQANLNAEQVGNLEVPHPSPAEQKRIANFLDAETARIDRADTAMRQQINLLAERRMRALDSAWPADTCFSMMRLGYGTELVTSGSRGWADFVGDSGTLFFRSANLRRDSLRPNLASLAHVQLPPSVAAEASRSRISRGDVLVGITGANAGWVTLADDSVEGGNVSQHVCLVRPARGEIDGQWLAYLIASPTVQTRLMGSQYGGTKTQLSLPDIRDIRVPVVPITMQQELATHVDGLLSILDKQRELRNRQLSVLAERRQALITAAVTGQIDVSTASGRGIED